MPTLVTKTIRGTGGDYATMAAFWAVEGKDLVAADENYIATFYDDAPFTTGGGYMSGGTADATRNYVFVVDALYDPGTGDGVVFQIDWLSAHNTIILTDYTEFSGVGFEAQSNCGNGLIFLRVSPGTSNVIVHSCFATAVGVDLSGAGTSIGFVLDGRDSLYYDLVVEGGGSATDGWQQGIDFSGNAWQNGSTLANSCVYDIGGGGTGDGIVVDHGSHVLQNCIVCDSSSADYVDTNSGTFSYCAASDSSATGTGALTSQTATDLWTDPANNDYSLKTGSNAIDAGTDLSGTFTDDYDGTAFGTGTGSWPMGAYDSPASASTFVPQEHTNVLIRR